MAVRDRVLKAIEAPVDEAAKLLTEINDPNERLTILVNGWFRGIAGALEEIASELDRRDVSGE